MREVALRKLPKDAAIMLCHEAVSPLLQMGSSNIVKILHVGFSRGLDSEPYQEGARLYIVTEFFLDSVHDLVSVYILGTISSVQGILYGCEEIAL